jgi:hypothetical protein
MTPIARRCTAILFALLAAVPAFAQAAPRSYSQAELDQMLAPIALYPDPVLAQVFIAATRPNEATEALAAFPQILQRMQENPAWARALGEAFVVQEPLVMETVQQLRQRAAAAGNLQSDAQIHVERHGPSIIVQPASPTVVYVPYYDPLVVYGPWWWPAYQPVAWAPWPGYARPYYASGFWWGAPVVMHRTVLVERHRWRPQPPRAHPEAQISPARQMQLRAQPVHARPQSGVARPNMRYHPPSFERQGAQGWTRSQSSPAPAAASARPPR